MAPPFRVSARSAFVVLLVVGCEAAPRRPAAEAASGVAPQPRVPVAVLDEPTPPALQAPSVASSSEHAWFLGGWKQDTRRSEHGGDVFVRVDRDVEPARHRDTYAFETGGRVDVGIVLPDDRTGSLDARWILRGATLVVIHGSETGPWEETFVRSPSNPEELVRRPR